MIALIFSMLCVLFGIHTHSLSSSHVKSGPFQDQTCLHEAPPGFFFTLVTSAAGLCSASTITAQSWLVQHLKLHPLCLVCARLPKSCWGLCVCVDSGCK